MAAGYRHQPKAFVAWRKTPVEKRRALEHGYGIDAVKTDKDGMYIEQDGKFMRPAES